MKPYLVITAKFYLKIPETKMAKCWYLFNLGTKFSDILFSVTLKYNTIKSPQIIYVHKGIGVQINKKKIHPLL